MKNVILIIFLIGTAIIAKAQVLVVNPQNNTGEGGEILLLKSNSTFNDWRIDNYRGVFRLHHSGKSYFNLSKSGDLSISGKIKLNATTNIEGGEIELAGAASFNDWRIDNYRGYFRLHHSGKSYLNLNKNGNLSLNGKIETKEIKVTNTPTADFVFEESYKLPSLDFIENYIKSKKHLPEIASAEKMKQDGVNIGDFQIQLLQKIEELTLYTIQQQKEIGNQQNKIQNQNEELKSLSQRLNEIEKLLKTNN
ncbi:hypothetical protein AWE51_18625 [Aquimarina aggregata]|uniref:Uncharacterized protein n=1 Tax=Aquimarina aggregata TaxID=1642818 RepID=A0A162WFL3_9FLAO|nr:hypothetical protein [Aquimarina aggregata]KZS38062.1 hypothetical protein AWE51_18625 [Aquimarina aggregata]